MKFAALPAIRKYLAGKPEGMFFEIETETLIAVAMQPDFFVRPKGNAQGIQDFGRLYFRHPKETLELVQLIRERLEDKTFQSRNIRRYLLTHKMPQNMTDAAIEKRMNAEGLKVSKVSVETERQKLCDELAGFAYWETPDMQKSLREGVTPAPPPVARKRKK